MGPPEREASGGSLTWPHKDVYGGAQEPSTDEILSHCHVLQLRITIIVFYNKRPYCQETIMVSDSAFPAGQTPSTFHLPVSELSHWRSSHVQAYPLDELELRETRDVAAQTRAARAGGKKE
ncbi:hypothetical protein AAFF_G00401590 [Aldrovandia affinis]|uniref:Uncharacterized protein n=1 Tax=Aldrovandia affinis TaxID=143900 RepID=A0AAD7SCQ5_9TELE|nr:hypothetical protein AAFF_G00401590 [Aldrovandia affinis]